MSEYNQTRTEPLNAAQEAALDLIFRFNKDTQDVINDFLRYGRLIYAVADYCCIEVNDMTDDEIIDLWGSRDTVWNPVHKEHEEYTQWGEPHPIDAVQFMRDNSHRCTLFVDLNHMTDSLKHILIACSAGIPVIYSDLRIDAMLVDLSRDAKVLMDKIDEHERAN